MEATCHALAVSVSLAATEKIRKLEQEVEDLRECAQLLLDINVELRMNLQRINMQMMTFTDLYMAFTDRVDGIFSDLFQDFRRASGHVPDLERLIQMARFQFLQARREMDRFHIPLRFELARLQAQSLADPILNGEWSIQRRELHNI